MSAPKSRHSDDRNSQMASLALLKPVPVPWSSCPPCWPGLVATCSISTSSRLLARGLEGPGVHPEQQDGDAHGAEQPAVEHNAVGEDRHAGRHDEREVRRRRHVDAMAFVSASMVTGGDDIAAVATVTFERGHRPTLVCAGAGGLVGAATREPNGPPVLVLGVLAVPILVASLDVRDLLEVVLRGRIRRDAP